MAVVRVLRSHSLVQCKLTPTQLSYHYGSFFLRCSGQWLIIITPNVRTLEKMNSGLYESPPCNAMLPQFTSHPIMPSAYLQTRVNLFLISNIWSYIWMIIDIKWLLIIQGFQLIGARRSCLWRWRSEPALPKGNDYDTGVEDKILQNIFKNFLQIIC